MRWWASASSAMERWRRPAAKSTRATTRLTSEAPAETTRPRPACSSGLGWSSRSTAAQAMASAATRMSAPSTMLEKYSALVWP